MFIIEQGREDRTNSFALNSRAELRDIRLVDARIGCPSRLADSPKNLEISVEFTPDCAHIEGSTLFVATSFTFKTGPADAIGEPVVFVHCRFEACYDLVEGYTPAKRELDAFREGNAIFNCWPFFREYVASTVVRSGYPPPPIGFLRLAPRVEPDAHEPSPEGKTRVSRPRKSVSRKKP